MPIDEDAAEAAVVDDDDGPAERSVVLLSVVSLFKL